MWAHAHSRHGGGRPTRARAHMHTGVSVWPVRAHLWGGRVVPEPQQAAQGGAEKEPLPSRRALPAASRPGRRRAVPTSGVTAGAGSKWPWRGVGPGGPGPTCTGTRPVTPSGADSTPSVVRSGGQASCVQRGAALSCPCSNRAGGWGGSAVSHWGGTRPQGKARKAGPPWVPRPRRPEGQRTS